MFHFTNLLLPYVVKIAQIGSTAPYFPNVTFLKLFTSGFFADKPLRYVIDGLVMHTYFPTFSLLPDQNDYSNILGVVNAVVQSRGYIFAVVVFKNEENKAGYMLVAERRAWLDYFELQASMQLPNNDYLYICHPKRVKFSLFDENPVLEQIN
ncbi:hypothetical protein [Mocis latipes granulovirus]|uniref:Uncharacterized protein n=1 Tax=Mocis latipes granulovirus TaxID=2072024 RepID=A0A162GWZ2_9BBAC|nr:hypothetical protein [Mocis latipes granulovirus]AKR17524.1 hypothetical protein [Mocis latipes granulovirus]